MNKRIDINSFVDLGLSQKEAHNLLEKTNPILIKYQSELAWQTLLNELKSSTYPFSVYLFLFQHLFPEWPDHLNKGPAWVPNPEDLIKTNIGQFMKELNFFDVKQFHKWTVSHYEEFWQRMMDRLHIRLKKPYKKICDLSQGLESPQWLVDAKLNIVDSCFNAPSEKTALIFLDKNNHIKKQSYGELNQYSNCIANSLIQQGFVAGDALAINMPMTADAVAIYLGIIKMGGVVVSIADSFSPEEIKTRLQIVNTKAIFTQDYILRNNKKLPLYEKVIHANAPMAIILPNQDTLDTPLRTGDIPWHEFLISNDQWSSHRCDPNDTCNLLFSSGTTGIPKAIPWKHTTPIKSASDGYFHQNIQPHDILAWPTNLGWMMGPWIIFAGFINQATLALYHDVPTNKAFGQFIEDAGVTILGVVPAMVASWRQTRCMEGLNWQTIKLFTSTAECSNPIDMFYLMVLGNYKPIIEYCGGTETGGSYITSTVIEKNYPSVLTTPAMGIDFAIIDETGQLSDNGEVALIPPSIGLSTELINANHHDVYYKHMPKHPQGKLFRRHGDQVMRLPDGNYCVLGRIDDTMNLGGIKISSAEIERVLTGIDDISETAAIAINPPIHGPSQLIIFAATQRLGLNKDDIKKKMQLAINQHLNPLFKIHDIVFIKELPKTASNKIMRRVLRKEYEKTKNS